MISPRDAFELSSAAGWNQTIADWERVIELSPEGCFGKYVDGRLVSTTVVVIHEPQLAWIAMVLTAPDHRGKGYARKLMEQALDYLDHRCIPCVKLDATD